MLKHMEQKNESTPLVTVITATYNLIENKRAKFIIQCLGSVHNQHYSNIEHIVIDGASNDGTLSLLKEYESQGWIKLFSEPDAGIYDAMNKGILKANGKYISILNSDDFFHDPEGIAISVKLLEENDADYSYADARVLKKSGRKFQWKGDLSKLLVGEHYCHQTMLVKTEVLRDMGGFDLSYRVSADSDLMIRLYALGYKHQYVPHCFVTYRYGGYSFHYDAQSRKDHSTSFFHHIGCHIGLSEDDCFQLWQLKFITEQTYKEQLALVHKVPEEFGRDYVYAELKKRNPLGGKQPEKKRYYLFGFIPVFQVSFQKNTYSLFGIFEILNVTCFNGKWNYKLLGVIPILKVKYCK